MNMMRKEAETKINIITMMQIQEKIFKTKQGKMETVINAEMINEEKITSNWTKCTDGWRKRKRENHGFPAHPS